MRTPARPPALESAGVPISELPGSNRLGHLLWEVSARVVGFAEQVMGEGKLSLSANGALEMIGSNPGITGSELARQSLKTQQAISQVTGRLVRLGYVERRVGPGRGVGLYLTEAGSAALAEGGASEQEVDRRLCELLGEEEAEQLRALLVHTRDRLADAHPE